MYIVHNNVYIVSNNNLGIDAILICFCEDETKNDGTPGREYYMSKNLMVSFSLL